MPLDTDLQIQLTPQMIHETEAKQERVDRAWLRSALIFGLTMSKDPECKLGACVVTRDNMKASFGYNGFPMGVPDTADLWQDKGMKNALVKHAEENAVSKAPFDTEGCTCYVVRKPCHVCLGTIVNARCRRVVWLEDDEQWKYMNDRAFRIMEYNCHVTFKTYKYTMIEAVILEAHGMRVPMQKEATIA